MYADRSFTSKVGVKSVNKPLVRGGGWGVGGGETSVSRLLFGDF